MQSLHIHVIKPGHLIFSMKLPPCLLIYGNHFHGGATAVLVDLVGSAVIFTVGAPQTSVSVKMNVSYLNAAYADAPSRKNKEQVVKKILVELVLYLGFRRRGI